MKEYLMQILEQKVNAYLAAATPKKDGVDGLCDLWHSFEMWLENE